MRASSGSVRRKRSPATGATLLILLLVSACASTRSGSPSTSAAAASSSSSPTSSAQRLPSPSPASSTPGARAPVAGAVPDGIDRPNPFRTGRTLVIAHGGGDGEFPEDTLYAYEHSVPLGSEVIDLDVQSTADGVVVALHDDTVDRTTNGKGAVKSMTFATLEKLDAGWDFEKNGAHPLRGKGITVPRVEDVLARYPTLLATLDLKDLSVDVVDPLCSMIRRLGRVDTIYVGVDTSEQVHEFRRACPEVRTSGTDEERAAARAARDRGDLTYRSAQTVGQPSYLAADGTPRVTAASITASHARNVAVMPWVVDDPATMRTLVAACVDGIYTRHPEVLRAIVDKETPAACALAAPASG